MPKKRFSAEQIVTLLRQIEVSMAQGMATPVACRDAGISLQSFYRWRKEYGGLEIDQAKRMKDLERENGRIVLPRQLPALTISVRRQSANPDIPRQYVALPCVCLPQPTIAAIVVLADTHTVG
jgi:putative transposase